MKIIRNLTMASCSLLLLTQCATKEEIRELNYQLRAVNLKVEDVRSNTVNQMQKRQANSVNKIDQVETETVRIKSLLEENAHQASLYREQGKEDIANLQATIEAIREENKALLRENEKRINVLEQQVAQIATNFESIQKQRVREAEKRAREAARRAEQAKRQTVVAAASGGGEFVKVRAGRKKIRVSSAEVVNGGSPGQQPSARQQAGKKASSPKPTMETVTTPDVTSGPFDKAMQQFAEKKYQAAYRNFEQVLAGNPQGSRAAQTLFYMGECLFNQGEYDLAILDYQKVISNHAQDPLTPQALLKQGMSFEKLTDHETAKIIYKKLLKDYASSREANQAKQRLGSL